MGKFSIQGIYTFKGYANSGIWSLPCEVQQSLVDVWALERQVRIVKTAHRRQLEGMIPNEYRMTNATVASSDRKTQKLLKRLVQWCCYLIESAIDAVKMG